MPYPGTKWFWLVDQLPADQDPVWIRPLHPAFHPVAAVWDEPSKQFITSGALTGINFPAILVPQWKPRTP